MPVAVRHVVFREVASYCNRAGRSWAASCTDRTAVPVKNCSKSMQGPSRSPESPRSILNGPLSSLSRSYLTKCYKNTPKEGFCRVLDSHGVGQAERQKYLGHRVS